MAFPTITWVAPAPVETMQTAHSFALGSPGYDAGDLIIVLFCGSQVGAEETYTITDPTDFTSKREEQWSIAGENRQNFGAFVKIATGAEDGTNVAVTTSAAVTGCAFVGRVPAATWSGDLAGVFFSPTVVEIEAANPNPPSVTIPWGAADTLAVAVATSEDSDFVATGAPSTYGTLQTTLSDGTEDATLSIAQKNVTGATEDPGAFTAASEKWQAFTMVVEPAGGAPPSEAMGGLIFLWQGEGIPEGEGIGTVTWAGVANGITTRRGASTGTVTWAGTAQGRNTHSGSSTGTVTWAGTATGDTPPNSGAATGTVTWAGVAAGTNVHRGSSTGAVAWAGTANGVTARSGASTGTVAWAGTAAGRSTHSGSSTGAVAWAGTAQGVSTHRGSATGSVTWAGSAAGETDTQGSSTGAVSWAGVAAGTATHSGASTGTVTWAGVASGASEHEGSSSGTVTWAGIATGGSQQGGAAIGNIVWAGSATGEAPATPVNEGEGIGTVSWAGVAAGSVTHSGAATGNITWVGIATGVETPIGPIIIFTGTTSVLVPVTTASWSAPSTSASVTAESPTAGVLAGTTDTSATGGTVTVRVIP